MIFLLMNRLYFSQCLTYFLFDILLVDLLQYFDKTVFDHVVLCLSTFKLQTVHYILYVDLKSNFTAIKLFKR